MLATLLRIAGKWGWRRLIIWISFEKMFSIEVRELH
jgi:hypothetical protein